MQCRVAGRQRNVKRCLSIISKIITGLIKDISTLKKDIRRIERRIAEFDAGFGKIKAVEEDVKVLDAKSKRLLNRIWILERR